LDEISRLEAQLSAYSRTSELTQINARAAREAVRVEPQLFRLLQLAKRLHGETGGAFDLTIAPLMRVWASSATPANCPTPPNSPPRARASGCRSWNSTSAEFTVRFARPGAYARSRRHRQGLRARTRRSRAARGGRVERDPARRHEQRAGDWPR